MKIVHTVNYQYGSYSGQTDIICDQDDDLNIIKAMVKRKKGLNFLSMASYSIEIVKTRNYDA